MTGRRFPREQFLPSTDLKQNQPVRPGEMIFPHLDPIPNFGPPEGRVFRLLL